MNSALPIIAKHTIPAGTKATRLSDYTIGIFAILPSRKSVKKAIKQGRVYVDGVVGTTGQFVQAGQAIALLAADAVVHKVFPLDLKVVYEDDVLAVIVKPAGYVVSGNRYQTIVNALPHNLLPSQEADTLATPQPVHRLDRLTSGLLLVAKTTTSRLRLGQAFAAGQIGKEYQAIAVGTTPIADRIELPVANKPSTTLLYTLSSREHARLGSLSWVRLVPLTGRTHQIRLHLAGRGTPVLGDPLYSLPERELSGKGLFLAATKLTFQHPVTQLTCTFEQPPPRKFEKMMRKR